ncbi:MAG TPA: caspase family protein, partial [Prosthecobacter sp.]
MKRAVMLAFYSLFLGSNLLCGGERVALVIGNDEYQHASKLSAAVNDATAVSLALQGLNFKVIRAMNAGVETMLEAVNKLKQTANGAESVLVYYAGHGIESGGVNYLVPVDARLEREVQLK